MPKVKISEYSATANSNTDVASINIDEGCAPSGINNAIRAVMGHLKDFQQGTNGDPFNGPVNGTVGATTPASGAFTTLSATGNVTLGDASTDTLNVGNGGLIKDASGNVGVGVTPSTINQGKGLEIFQAGYGLWNGTASTYVMANAYFNSGFKYGVTGQQATTYYQYQGTHVWNTAASGTAGNPISFTQAMTLNASGLLGIGQTSPQFPLHITGASGVNTYAHFTNATTGNSASDGFSIGVANGASDAYIIQRESANLFFYTNALERACIDSSGALMVGTSVLTPQTGKLKVVHDTGGQNIATSINSAASNPYGDVISFSGASPNNGSNYFLLCADSTINRAIIYSNGGLANYSANNSNLSDRREKTNFAPAKSYLDVICAIPVQTFNYIDQNMEDDGGLTLGVVAQDVQAVAPELVMESNWAKEGDAPKMRLSIYQTDLQYALMKCIQEQQAIITTLTARITALEGA
jgi:hypothetical protein